MGYEYKIIAMGDYMKIIGVHFEKEPIGFMVKDDKLVRVEISL